MVLDQYRAVLIAISKLRIDFWPQISKFWGQDCTFSSLAARDIVNLAIHKVWFGLNEGPQNKFWISFQCVAISYWSKGFLANEVYHNIDGRRYLVWFRRLIFVAFPGQFMVSFEAHWSFFSTRKRCLTGSPICGYQKFYSLSPQKMDIAQN